MVIIILISLFLIALAVMKTRSSIKSVDSVTHKSDEDPLLS